MRLNDVHPLIALVYFTSVIVCALVFSAPLFIAVGLVTSAAYAWKVAGRRGVIASCVGLVLICFYMAYYAYYSHEGVTALGTTFAGNTITLESVVYALSWGLRALIVAQWLVAAGVVMTTDKFTALSALISARLARATTVVWRTLPQAAETLRRRRLGQRCMRAVGRRGTVTGRVRFAVRQATSGMSAVLDGVMARNAAGGARGARVVRRERGAQAGRGVEAWRGERVRRSCYARYRFENRDRVLLVVLVGCSALMCLGAAMGSTSFGYLPRIIWMAPLPADVCFLLGYAVYAGMGFGLEL